MDGVSETDDRAAAEAHVARRLAALGIERATSYRLGTVAAVLGLAPKTVRAQVHRTPAGSAPRIRAWRIGPGANWRVDHDELVRRVAELTRDP